MLEVTLSGADFNRGGFVKIGAIARAIARANESANINNAERKIFAQVNAAVQLRQLRPMSPETLTQLPSNDYGTGIVTFSELVEWGRQTKLYDFKTMGGLPGPVDWDVWTRLPEVKAFEAVLLMHGTEPDGAPPDPMEVSQQYRKTLRLLLGGLSDRAFFSPGTINMGDSALHGVRLIEVGKWALANGYELPERFPRPAAISKAPPPINPIRPSYRREVQSEESQSSPDEHPPKAQRTKGERRWTDEFIAEVRAYRMKHTEKETAHKYGVSGSLIRRKLASPKKPKAQPFSGLVPSKRGS